MTTSRAMAPVGNVFGEASETTIKQAVAVAYGRNFDPRAAVESCARELGDITPTLLLVFVGGKHDPEEVLRVLREYYPDVAITGGSAAGVVSAAGLGYSGLEVGVMAFCDPALTPRLFVQGGMLEGERAAGRALGAAVAEAADPGAVVLLLFDSVASTAPPRLHFASSLVDGFQDGLGNRRVVLIGGGLLTDINLSDGWVYVGDSITKHAAVALVFPSDVAADSVVLHGCRPISTFMRITRVEGAEVFELDGEPALSVIERMLGVTISEGLDSNLTLIATLGEKHGDPFAPYDENAYVNRLILRSDRAQGSITLFEPDFRVGTRVQIMSRDNTLMLQSVKEGVAATNAAMARGDSLFSLYIDCAGRASVMSGAPTEEADIVRRMIDSSVPFLGFYSGVEVAPFEGGYSRPLDWTGVLVNVRRHRA